MFVPLVWAGLTVCQALKGCPLLRRLSLCAVEFTSSSLRRSLRVLPSLRDLVVRTLPTITQDALGDDVRALHGGLVPSR
jgi:hypothetical protein